jgi:hypothetical protein
LKRNRRYIVGEVTEDWRRKPTKQNAKPVSGDAACPWK